MKKKSTYRLLTVFGGFIGLHKFYMESYGAGTAYLLTLGLLGFGWFGDIRKLAHVGSYIDKYNTERGYISTRR